jgi:ABC-type dipeptide/oligopeptide/nickel transport system permease component
MLRWLLVRSAWAVVTLIGITFVTFVVIDRAPVDRAELAVMHPDAERVFANAAARDAAIRQLRIRHGLIDPVTGEPVPAWRRYGRWLGDAALLRFAGPGEDHGALWRRLGAALPVTAWLGGLALLVAFGLGMPLGAWLGLRAGTRADRTVSAMLLVGAGIPEFLAGTLLLLALSSAWLQWLPASGLRSPGSENWLFAWQLVDFARHLVLPVTVMALGPLVLVTRFVRDSVARAAKAPFVASMHALGIDARIVRARLLRHGCAPVATLAGSLLPMLVGGSIVVENLFALDGVGHLAFGAARQREQPMLMTIVVISSIATLVAFVLSDLLHRIVDSRVRLQR